MKVFGDSLPAPRRRCCLVAGAFAVQKLPVGSVFRGEQHRRSERGRRSSKISEIRHEKSVICVMGDVPKGLMCVVFIIITPHFLSVGPFREAFSVPFFVLVLFFKGPKEAAHMSARTHREQV